MMTRDETLDPKRLKQAKQRGNTHTPEELLKVLPSKGLITTDWMTLVNIECGISRTSFHRLKAQLEKLGRVRKDMVNGRWSVVGK